LLHELLKSLYRSGLLKTVASKLGEYKLGLVELPVQEDQMGQWWQ